MPDFAAIPGQLDQWSHAVSAWFRSSIEAQSQRLQGQRCQYYDELDPAAPQGPYLDQEIVWNAFPGNQFHR